MSTKDTLEQYLALRELGVEEAQVAETLARLPQTAESLATRAEAKRTAMKSAAAEAAAAVARTREIEAALKDDDARQRRYREQIAAAHTTAEMQAFEAQIAHVAHEAAALEDEGLALVEKEEKARQREAAAAAELKELEEKLAAERARADGRRAEEEKRLALVRAERDNRLKTLDDEARDLWERLAARHGAGGAIVPLINMAQCGGCNMNVVLQTREETLRMDHLARCEKCGRVLYDPERFGEAPKS